MYYTHTASHPHLAKRDGRHSARELPYPTHPSRPGCSTSLSNLFLVGITRFDTSAMAEPHSSSRPPGWATSLHEARLPLTPSRCELGWIAGSRRKRASMRGACASPRTRAARRGSNPVQPCCVAARACAQVLHDSRGTPLGLVPGPLGEGGRNSAKDLTARI